MIDRTGSDPQPYRFTGEPFDRNLGLAYHRARWLDPAAGRFLGMDPFEGFSRNPISLHRYLYANADPANVVDPTGEFGLAGLNLSAVRIAAARVAFRVFLRVQYLLLVSPLALPLIAKLSNIATLGFSATFLLNRMATAMLTNTEVPPPSTASGGNALSSWSERKTGANLGKSFEGIDHWDPDNRMGVQQKIRNSTNPVTLAREIEKAARKLQETNTTKALEGAGADGRPVFIQKGKMKTRGSSMFTSKRLPPACSGIRGSSTRCVASSRRPVSLFG